MKPLFLLCFFTLTRARHVTDSEVISNFVSRESFEDLAVSAAEPRPVVVEYYPSEVLPLTADQHAFSDSEVSQASEKVEKILQRPISFSYQNNNDQTSDASEVSEEEEDEKEAEVTEVDQKPDTVDYYKYVKNVESAENDEGAGNEDNKNEKTQSKNEEIRENENEESEEVIAETSDHEDIKNDDNKEDNTAEDSVSEDSASEPYEVHESQKGKAGGGHGGGGGGHGHKKGGGGHGGGGGGHGGGARHVTDSEVISNFVSRESFEDLAVSAAEPRPVVVEYYPSEVLPLTTDQHAFSDSEVSQASGKVEKILQRPISFSYQNNNDQTSGASEVSEEEDDEKEAEVSEVDQKPDAVDYYKYVKNVESAENDEGSHKKGGGKESYSSHKGEKGEKGDKGYKGHHHHEKGDKGHHTKENHEKEYEEKGGEKKNHHHDDGYSAEYHKGEKGNKGSKYHEEGKHSKGHSTKGEHSIHKKDEYEKKQEFYDESHEEDGFEKDGEYFHEDDYKKGSQEKGSFDKGGEEEAHYGKKHHHDKGGHFKEQKGHKGSKGHDSHHEHEEKHGKKGSDSGGKKWSYGKGNGGGGGGGGGGGHKKAHLHEQADESHNPIRVVYPEELHVKGVVHEAAPRLDLEENSRYLKEPNVLYPPLNTLPLNRNYPSGSSSKRKKHHYLSQPLPVLSSYIKENHFHPIVNPIQRRMDDVADVEHTPESSKEIPVSRRKLNDEKPVIEETELSTEEADDKKPVVEKTELNTEASDDEKPVIEETEENTDESSLVKSVPTTDQVVPPSIPDLEEHEDLLEKHEALLNNMFEEEAEPVKTASTKKNKMRHMFGNDAQSSVEYEDLLLPDGSSDSDEIGSYSKYKLGDYRQRENVTTPLTVEREEEEEAVTTFESPSTTTIDTVNEPENSETRPVVFQEPLSTSMRPIVVMEESSER
ncbi:sarcoplasmic reticulum histidine-rich calcium-binding protein-like [Diabrotica virgifera virgifera]|uniref:Uncharacterized protein n=1 Tax=Diabrotica virgifera virgifera TaxID=50390 RepID=A0ABM5KSB3_DIAVI|nr:sarcoplasmic reticulum histidine-rich calcium-binding protein-like [Diabrotica virgifera virgifera]